MSGIYVGGSTGSSVRIPVTMTASGTISSWDTIVSVDASLGNIQLVLPVTNATSKGHSLDIIRIDNSNNIVSIDGNGTDLINNSSNLIYLYGQNDSIEITSLIGDSKINNNRNSIGSTMSYIKASTPATTSMTITIGSNIMFNNVEDSLGTKANYDSTTGILSLKANTKWRIRAFLEYFTYTAPEGFGEYQLYNITNTTYVGVRGMSVNVSRAQYESKTPIIEYTFTPTVDTQIALRPTTGTTGVINCYGGFIEAEEISRQVSVINTMDCLSLSRISSDVTNVGINNDLLFNNIVYGNIPYNTTTSIITLTAGKTYELISEPSFTTFSDTTNGYLLYEWVDAATNTALVASNQGAGVAIPINRNSNELDSDIAHIIYTPITNQQVKLRVTSGVGTATFRSGVGTKAIIKQIGSTAVNMNDIGLVGEIKTYAGVNAPLGWLLCDGSAILRTLYPTLFGIIGTMYGSGDGSTTFNLPDMRGRVLRGSTASFVDIPVTSISTNVISTNVQHKLNRTGVKVRLVSGTVTGISTGITYYAIVDSTTTFRVSSSLANAIAGTPITISSPSSAIFRQWEDPDANSRVSSTVGGNSGNNVGSMQDDMYALHSHNPHLFGRSNVVSNGSNLSIVDPGTRGSDYGSTSIQIDSSGGNETRMANIAVNYIIKY